MPGLRHQLLLILVTNISIAKCDLSGILYPEDSRLNTIQLLKKYGYPSEVHYVTTKDGYILKTYRIPFSPKCKSMQQLPVILMHGLEGCSTNYLAAGNEAGLAYVMADNCYDVWLPNNRGNFESENHTSIDPKSKEFWQFSWHELGLYDTPAIIDFILSQTNQNQLHFVGLSQGNTQFFVYASLFPEESARKVKTMHALGPAAFLSHVKNPFIKLLAPQVDNFEFLTNFFGLDKFIPKSEFFAEFGRDLCFVQRPAFFNACGDATFLLCGFDSELFNATTIQVASGTTPSGAATKQVIHYGQLVNSGMFRQYDYGKRNYMLYGQSTPPDYEIERIKVPMFLYYSDNDWLASTEDVNIFASKTPSSVLVKNKFEKFNHCDFIFGNRLNELVNNVILDNIKRQEHANVE